MQEKINANANNARDPGWTRTMEKTVQVVPV
jgi:hypothetical protein